MPNFFKSFFSGKSETPESEKQKNDQKNFEIFKYDGLRAQRMGRPDYAVKCFIEALAIKEEFETMGYLSQLYIQMGETAKARELLEKMAAMEPDVAILNAKRLDNTYPYTHLSGCGVGFKFMQAFAISNGIEFHHLIPLLDIVAVSIASDIVPIMGENRILAYHGLKQLNSNPSIGMKAIIDVCGLSEKEITVSDIVFKIGPRINASGRIQNGKEAVDLLTEKDFSVALEKAGQINQYNETRKDLDKSMTEEANNIVANLEGLADRRSIVLYNEEWHKGVIGIVASRLTEVYYRPAVVLTRTDDMATGSARSVSGFDVYKAIEHCRDLLENFGGHTYAAGLSMKVENVNAFTKRFEEYVSQHILPEQTSAVIEIDAEIDFRDISSKFFSDLKKFNPFGPDNTKPIFCTHHVYDYGTSKVVGRDQEHIKLELVDNKSMKEIAESLNVTVKGVDYHNFLIFRLFFLQITIPDSSVINMTHLHQLFTVFFTFFHPAHDFSLFFGKSISCKIFI
jgi:single-stranded-DNA-specific exonuclease RecJ